MKPGVYAMVAWLALGGPHHAVAAPESAPAKQVFICTDAQGRRLTSDRPIPECIDREQRVLGPSGTLRERRGPVLTEEERAAQELQRRREAEERARLQEERRRERVLIARYPNQGAHDAERAQAVQQVDDVTAVAHKRVAELQAQRLKLESEMEFYQRDPSKAPMHLRRAIAENQDAVAEQQRFISGQVQEKQRVNQRFDVELLQLRKLWAERDRPVPTSGGAAKL